MKLHELTIQQAHELLKKREISSQELTKAVLDRIEPNDPDNSYLVRKIEGGPGISGGRMPAGGAPPLDPSVIQIVRDWVSAGAPNN